MNDASFAEIRRQVLPLLAAGDYGAAPSVSRRSARGHLRRPGSSHPLATLSKSPLGFRIFLHDVLRALG